ncbi:Uncharacterized protein AXF42_Ash007120 [Apostasia shenzhenica]|uniref:Uncharacterized protein n=1 Tax=Apostasia shenzhenica TaxID=1088818 RepID=A0A2I0BF74_9ASPA|nr:Uncharacterized protein AXF42_Ash007120 [Apostasia shenzhenica]
MVVFRRESMRRVNEHDSVEVVNAAANAIVSAEGRVQPVAVPQRKRWKKFLSAYWCFGSHAQSNRISQAILVPEPTAGCSNASAPENFNPIPLQVFAPPSSPSSFIQSEPPSAIESPANFLSLSSVAEKSLSPPSNSFIFTVGPYANDTQLVSPPVFSTFTTEPSTAPLTPPDTLQIAPYPEVPFAQLLSATFGHNLKETETCDFQPYPVVDRPISSTFLFSGTSSPLHNTDFHHSVIDCQIARDGSSNLDGQIAVLNPTMHEKIGRKLDDTAEHRDSSFEFRAQDVGNYMLDELAIPTEVDSIPPRDLTETATARTRDPSELTAANSKLLEKVNCSLEPNKNWAFQPFIQPGVS